MTAIAGATIGLIGALAAFPRRLAAREVQKQRGCLRRGVSRRTSHVVFGRTLLHKLGEARIEARFDAETRAGRRLVSERGFLRLLDLVQAPKSSDLTRQSLIDQSKLAPRTLDLLSLFDAFEHDAEPYSFRDLILARKYRGLLEGGATWSTIARSVHRSGSGAPLTAQSLHVGGTAGGTAIYAHGGDRISELDGQMLLDLGACGEAELEDLFAQAEAAEEDGAYDAAAAMYQRCLGLDPSDAFAAFNRANCLRLAGRPVEAAHEYSRAVKLDAHFVEAWFNLAGLMSDLGRVDSARRHLQRAIALDQDYADAVYNLASLEYEAGELAEARRHWVRYLELDSGSEWARTAARGIQFVDQQAAG